ncbi:MAG: hypothetical protein AB7P02_12935 [Alphaproteobacteria bacterium]
MREARKTPVEELANLMGGDPYEGELTDAQGVRVHLTFKPGAKIEFSPEFAEIAQVAVSCGHDVYVHKPDLDAVRAIGDEELRDKLLRCVMIRRRTKTGKPLAPSVTAKIVGAAS